MSLTSLQLPPPATWQALEALCWDLFSTEWGTREAYRHGRNGQRQYGVDIVARLSHGWVGVQCKNLTLGKKFSEAELRACVSEARTFQPALVQLSIVVTAPKDERLQRIARDITDQHLKEALFSVHIVWWTEVCARLDLQPQTVARHFPMLARFHAAASTPSTDFSVRIDNFSAQYLSSADRAIAFGGRDRELADLDGWLHTDAEPYRLIRAGAGRGKSALLVQWLHRLVAPVTVIFMPISVRFRTNLAQVVFPSMLKRLAALHDQVPPEMHELSPEVCRGLVSDLLARPPPHEKGVLLVIDGLDEAADFELGADFLPSSPPPGLKVLLSGRPVLGGVDPLATLVKGRIETLAPLTDSDAAGIARQAGVAPSIAPHVVRLAEGDPLLLRHYIEGVLAGEFHPERMSQTPSGMRGFFEHWWRDQVTLWAGLTPSQHLLIEEVMGVLSCALAPMRMEEVLACLAAGRELSTIQFDAAIARLGRLLVGDARTEGLAFAHPRFADYIREEWMPQAKRADVERRFIAWGLRTLDEMGSTLAPAAVSTYLVRNLGAHLERSGQSAAVLSKLTSRRWADGWHTQEPSLAGFLIDVERCYRVCARQLQIETAPAAIAPLINIAVTCAQAASSVVTVREEFPPALYVAALRLGYWTPAVVIAHVAGLQYAPTRRDATIAIAPVLGAAWGHDLLALALSCAEPTDQCAALVAVYRYLDADDHAVAAAGIARYARAHGALLLDLTQLNDADIAERIAREFPDPTDRGHALASLLPCLPAADRARIEQEVISLVRAHRRAFADRLVYAGRLQHLSPELRGEAIDLILGAIDGSDEDHVGVIAEFAAGGESAIVPALIRSAQRIGDFWAASRALQAIAPLVSEEDIPAYLAATDPEDAGALAALGAYHTGEWAMRALALSKDGYYHSSIRGPILVEASRLLDESQRLALVPKIVATLSVAESSDQDDSDGLLAEFAETFVPASSSTALLIVSKISEADVQARAVSRLYLKAAASDRPAWLEFLRQVEDCSAVLAAYCDLAQHTSGAMRDEFCNIAREYALATGQARSLITAAVEAGWELPTALGVEVIKRALEISLPLDPRGLALALTGLAPGASSHGADVAVSIASHLDNDFLRLSVIPAFASKFTANALDGILSGLDRWTGETPRQAWGTLMAQAFAALFDHLSGAQQTVAVEMARRFTQTGDFTPLATCAARLGKQRRDELIAEIEEGIGKLPSAHQRIMRGIVDGRLRGLDEGLRPSPVTPTLGETYSLEQLMQALHESARRSRQVAALGVQAGLLAQQPHSTQVAGLDAALRFMARCHRGQCSSILGMFQGVLSAVAGTAGVDAALEAVNENVRSWR